MTRSLFFGVLLLAASVAPALAQSRGVVTENAPIYAQIDSVNPVRTAASGTVLEILGEMGRWLQVRYADPQVGSRVGYIEARFVRADSATVPLDLSVRSPAQAPRPRPTPSGVRPLTRSGFWVNAGAGYGTLRCGACGAGADGASGGIALGWTMNEQLLLGVGTTAWYRSKDGVRTSAGTVDARARYYPLVWSGFFVNGGVGLGAVNFSTEGLAATETGLGMMLGLGWDIRMGDNFSLTPFLNVAGIRTSVVDVNFGQIGLGFTIH